MLKLDRILGQASEPAMAERLHALDHAGRIEYVVLAGEDTRRHRLHVSTDRGTECAIMLPRSEHLENGTVLHLSTDRAIVVRLREEQWLPLLPRDAAAALELGYFAGNMHWPVRFDGATLRIALHGPEQAYLARLEHLLADGRVRRADADG